MPDDDRVYVFDSGTQYADWCENCAGCSKALPPDPPWPDVWPCEIEQAISGAAVGDGKVPLPIADRMGATANKGRYGWGCPEREPAWANVPRPADVADLYRDTGGEGGGP